MVANKNSVEPQGLAFSAHGGGIDRILCDKRNNADFHFGSP
jgi:hypothetical protein